jgi:hypothetical protein
VVNRCRLFVILARSAPVAAILRRGPRKWTRLIKWHTATDAFEAGQWFHGDIYERRCDLSPSGRRLLYFAAKHHLREAAPGYTGTWTAISKIPYLTALSLWPNGGTTHHGGGLFVAEDVVALNSYQHRWSNPDRNAPAPHHPDHAPPHDLKVEPLAFTGGDQLLPVRLVRDGWRLTTPGDLHTDLEVQRGRLVRSMVEMPCRLQLDFDARTLAYSLLDFTPAGGTNPLAGATWADWDQQGRLVFAKEGRLFGVRPGIWEPQLLADFNTDRPKRLPPPEWARTW